ncbi:protein of unknown function DUF490 [Anaeromyxobacter sp. K]|uniref:translocation/assembly module TamB domain-containing protein n=1 Tax=Anaeromyxobacter sp. (strain K) TaxID=447217 RepID=UPI00015F9CF7|nr:translocation/assembly module TamB [Anaeromyxobacter sp. K]ACG71416.1 protein of unknown function DUF490 [Anaeromyxobacter sp. K]
MRRGASIAAAIGAVAGAVGWLLLGLAAFAGVALSAAILYASWGVGRPVVANALVRIADDALAGSFQLDRITVLPQGGIELHGLRVFDPEGRLVLEVGRAAVFADLTRLRNRVIGVTAELDRPSVLVEEGEGGLSIARAFAPSHPSPPRPPGAPAPRDDGSGWTLRVERLTLRGGDLWWVDGEGATRLEAQALDLDARGVIGPRRARVQLRLRGAADVPVPGALALDVRLARDGDVLRVSVLRARHGDTVLEAIGEGDLARRSGRLAITRLGVDSEKLRALAPEVALGGDLAAAGYAESDGDVATAALHVAPRAGESRGGGDAAVAVRLDGSRSLGAEVALDALDPSRIWSGLPRGAVTLRARGGLSGTTLDDLRGRAQVSLSRSTVRGGELGPGELTARADRGSWEVERLTLQAPGVALLGSGRWREGAGVSGRVSADAGDLARLAANLERLLGQALPPLAGRARVEATLSGTSRAPVLDGTVEGPHLAVGSFALDGAKGSGHVAGPFRAVTGRLHLTADRVRSGGAELARALLLDAELAAADARLDASADVPALGREPVAVQARALRTERGDEVILRELAIAYPGTRYALTAPARLSLTGPRVDRLELASGAQRIRLEGGIGARGALDARAEVEALRLEGLPVGVLPSGAGLAGELSAQASVSGTTRRPVAQAHLTLAGGRFRGLDGLRAVADAAWDGGARRARLDLSAARGAGGTADVRLDLPLPLQGRPGEPVSARVRGEALPLGPILQAAGAALPASGEVALEVALEGAIGAPSLRAEASLTGGAWDDLSAIGLGLTAEAPGERLTARLEATLEGRPAVSVRGEAPLDLSDLLTRPAAAIRALRAGHAAVDARVPGLDLAALAGRLGLPDDLAGRLSGDARLEGTLSAPRGRAAFQVEGGAASGVSGLGVALEAEAGAHRVGATVRLAMGGEEVLRGEGSLAAAPERLLARGGLRSAPLSVVLVVPHASLARTSTSTLLVEGTVDARLTADGTLAAPRLALEAEGRGLQIEGRPLGDVTSQARWADGRGSARVTLAARAGGTLEATAAVDAPLGLDTRAADLRRAPAELALRARDLDLGFLPAVLSGWVRTASGKLQADVTARGPLARPSPRGTVRLADGRLAVSEYGDWTQIEVDASVTDDAVEIRRVAARRAHGSFEAHGALRGMGGPDARLEGRIVSRELPIMRAGMELATLDLQVDATGGYQPGALQVKLTVPRGTIRLPKRAPRALQPLERRRDIVVGRQPEPKRAPLPVPRGPGERPFTLTAQLVAPGRLMVVSDNPRIRVELKANVTYELSGANDFATGTIEVVRGEVEPIGGRNFQIERGKVTFTGGPPRAALLDVEATYDNPVAKVTVAVAGPVSDPEIRLSSQPPMDDGQIALLIATGRTELKPGSGGVGTLTGEEAGRAALGAVATQAFKNLVADKLPLDTVAVDAGALRAGKYVTDKIYVGYTRRFDVQLEQGQNVNEVRVEYQITRRWTFESRYGDAQSGGASLIWSRDY